MNRTGLCFVTLYKTYDIYPTHWQHILIWLNKTYDSYPKDWQHILPWLLGLVNFLKNVFLIKQ